MSEMASCIAIGIAIAIIGTLATVEVRRHWHQADVCKAHDMRRAPSASLHASRLCVDALGHTFQITE